MSDPATAAALAEVASAHERLGHFDDARIALEQALAMLATRPGGAEGELITTLNRIARVCLRLGRLEEARKYAQRALRIAEQTFGPDSSALAQPLAALAEGLGDREAAVAREISKKFEECVTGSLTQLAERYAEAPPKGEIVVVVAPPGAPAPASADDADAALAEALTRLPASKAAGEVAKKLGLDRKALYARAMAMKE